MVGLIALGVLATMLLVSWLMLRPKKTPKEELRDMKSYRDLVAFAKEVAYWNDTLPTYQIESAVPTELSSKARVLLDREKKELRNG